MSKARWTIYSAIDRCLASGPAERFVFDKWVDSSFLPGERTWSRCPTTCESFPRPRGVLLSGRVDGTGNSIPSKISNSMLNVLRSFYPSYFDVVWNCVVRRPVVAALTTI
jgi:hypothetical protein